MRIVSYPLSCRLPFSASLSAHPTNKSAPHLQKAFVPDDKHKTALFLFFLPTSSSPDKTSLSAFIALMPHFKKRVNVLRSCAVTEERYISVLCFILSCNRFPKVNFLSFFCLQEYCCSVAFLIRRRRGVRSPQSTPAINKESAINPNVVFRGQVLKNKPWHAPNPFIFG